MAKTKSRATLSREALVEHFQDLTIKCDLRATDLAYQGKHDEAGRALLEADGYRRARRVVEVVDL